MLTESPSDEELQRLVERGELDLAFAMPPLLDGPFESLELLSDPYVLLVPAEHEVAELPRAGLAELGDLTLIGNRACRSTQLAEDELTQQGVTVDVAFRSDDNGTVQGLVGAGFGAALVPLLTVNRHDERVRVLDLDPEIASPHRARLAPRPPPLARCARAFVDVAVDVCAEVAARLRLRLLNSIAARAASNCSSVRRMYEWRQSELGKTPTSSAGIERSRSSRTTSGRIANDQRQRSRSGSSSGSDVTSTTANTACQTLA